jgi:hypothetical protein
MSGLQWSDEELQGRSLSIADPSDQEGLVAAMPPDASLIGVENTYQLPRSMPKARCAKCHRAIHWSGWTGLLSSGERVLLGKKCGGDAFGSWDDATAELEAKRSRQFSLRRLRVLRERTPAILGMLPPWRAAAATADRMRLRIETDAPELFEAISAAAKIGALKAYCRVQVRDIGPGQTKLKVRHEEVSFGPFTGAAWLACGQASHKPEAVVGALQEVERVLSGDTNQVSSRHLRALRDRVDSALHGQRKLQEGLQSLAAVFAAPGVDQLSRWAARASLGEVGRITRAAEGFAVRGASFALPQDFVVPSGDLLTALDYSHAQAANDR